MIVIVIWWLFKENWRLFPKIYFNQKVYVCIIMLIDCLLVYWCSPQTLMLGPHSQQLVYLHDQTGYTTNNYLVSCRTSSWYLSEQQYSTPRCGARVHQEQYPTSPNPVHYELQIVGGAGWLGTPQSGPWSRHPRVFVCTRRSPAARRHLAARRGHVNKIV